MCGRFVLKASAEELMERFGLTERPDITIGFNMAPSMQLPVIVASENETRRLEHMSWGFPSRDKRPLINAKSETAANLRTWAQPLRETSKNQQPTARDCHPLDHSLPLHITQRNANKFYIKSKTCPTERPDPLIMFRFARSQVLDIASDEISVCFSTCIASDA